MGHDTGTAIPARARDIPSHHYSYSFSEALQQEWTWSEKYAAQPEILAYLNFVADKFDLTRDIQFETAVISAHFNEGSRRWEVRTSAGELLIARFFIPAVGTLSHANIPKFPGASSFQGEVYFTGQWPKDGVDFRGKRVGIIGTGATAMQAIPLIAQEADHLTVFQRTPNFAAPLMNEPMRAEVDREAKQRYTFLRRGAWESFAGVPFERLRPSALADTPAERQAHYEACWQGTPSTRTAADFMQRRSPCSIGNQAETLPFPRPSSVQTYANDPNRKNARADPPQFHGPRPAGRPRPQRPDSGRDAGRFETTPHPRGQSQSIRLTYGSAEL
ncbi:Flavin-binding monooxygenase-like protein [compost metagenome]